MAFPSSSSAQQPPRDPYPFATQANPDRYTRTRQQQQQQQQYTYAQPYPQYAHSQPQQQYYYPYNQYPPIPQPPLVPPLASFVNWLASLPPISTWPAHIIDILLLAPLSTLLAHTRDFLLSPRLHRVVLRLSVLVTIFWFALAAAIVSYVGFYRAWVPHVGLRKQVWLQYGMDEPPFCNLQFDHSDPDLNLDLDLDLPNPSASASHFFAENQAYDVTLEIGVPLNDANLDLGNFMVTLDLKSRSDRTIFRASRPTLLTYSPRPVRAVSSLFHILTRSPPPSTMPTDSHLLRVPLLRRVVPRPADYSLPLATTPRDPAKSRRVTHGRVTVGRKDAQKYWMYGGNTARQSSLTLPSSPSRGELQTYGAVLRFDAHLTGLRFFMYYYPVLSFLLFTALFLALELSAALTLWGVAAIYTTTLTPEQLSLAPDEHLQSDLKGKRHRSPSRSRSQVKTESGTEDTTRTESESLSDESGTETETEADRLGPRFKRQGGSSRTGIRVKQEADAEAELEQLRALENLRAQELGLRAARLREMSRLGSGGAFEQEAGMSGRVLSRLDEETEEETGVSESDGDPESSGMGSSSGTGTGTHESEARQEDNSDERWEDIDTPSQEEEAQDELAAQGRSSSIRQASGTEASRRVRPHDEYEEEDD